MHCPECGLRKARRACPALHRDICPVCCATKRQKEIRCPPDCPYLVTARQHPPAAQVRQQERDLGRMVELLRDFSEAQARLFLTVNRFLAEYTSPDLQRLIDDDVEAAADALASTHETAARGVIYEHQPRSVPAEHLARALKPLMAGAGEQNRPATAPDSAVVLRRLAEAVRQQRQDLPGEPRAYVHFAERVLRDPATDRAGSAGSAGLPGGDLEGGPRLILP